MIWTREVQRVRLIPAVQRVDNTIQRINRYPKDKGLQNELLFPPDSDLFNI